MVRPSSLPVEGVELRRQRARRALRRGGDVDEVALELSGRETVRAEPPPHRGDILRGNIEFKEP